MSERKTQNEILLGIAGKSTLFRNNVAKAWVGEAKKVVRTGLVTVHPGDVVVRQARVLHAGLQKGSGDLIGWTEVVITEDMVGKTVAVFSSVEVKPPKGGRIAPEQEHWAKTVENAGGYAGIARSADDAKRILRIE